MHAVLHSAWHELLRAALPRLPDHWHPTAAQDCTAYHHLSRASLREALLRQVVYAPSHLLFVSWLYKHAECSQRFVSVSNHFVSASEFVQAPLPPASNGSAASVSNGRPHPRVPFPRRHRCMRCVPIASTRPLAVATPSVLHHACERTSCSPGLQC